MMEISINGKTYDAKRIEHWSDTARTTIVIAPNGDVAEFAEDENTGFDVCINSAKLETLIKRWVAKTYGTQEAEDPSWDIESLAETIAKGEI